MIYIIGNKTDLNRKVNKENVLTFINNNYKNYNVYYKEISIIKNIPNVNDIYNEFIINLYRLNNKKKLIHNNTTININKNNKKCCLN